MTNNSINNRLSLHKFDTPHHNMLRVKKNRPFYEAPSKPFISISKSADNPRKGGVISRADIEINSTNKLLIYYYT